MNVEANDVALALLGLHGPPPPSVTFPPPSHSRGRSSIAALCNPEPAPVASSSRNKLESLLHPTPAREPSPSAEVHVQIEDEDVSRAAEAQWDCICRRQDIFNDPFSVQCEKCERWCHGSCVGLVRVPENEEQWLCWECNPSSAPSVLAASQRIGTKEEGPQDHDKDKNGREKSKAKRKSSPGIDRKPRRPTANGASDGNKRKRRGSVAHAQPEPRHPHLAPSLLTPSASSSSTTLLRPLATSPHPGTPHQVQGGGHTDLGPEWPSTLGYVHISHDIIPHPETRLHLRHHARHWRGVSALDPPPPSPHDTTLDPPGYPFNTAPIALAVPADDAVDSTYLRQLPSPNPALAPTYALHAATSSPAAAFLASYPSTVIPATTYISDPLNGYAQAGLPRRHVHILGGPPSPPTNRDSVFDEASQSEKLPRLDVALDARSAGGHARWARSGCRPNAVVRPFFCSSVSRPHKREGVGGRSDGRPNVTESSHAVTIEDGSEMVHVDTGDTLKHHESDDVEKHESVHRSEPETESLAFGVFALRDLKADEEIVLGWEWDDGSAIHHLPALLHSPHVFPPHHLRHLRRQLATIVHSIASTYTTCACGASATDCALRRMSAFVEVPTPPTTPPISPMSSRVVDVGPLVSNKRGFRTREQIPFSGGMGDLEIVATGTTPSTSVESEFAPATLTSQEDAQHVKLGLSELEIAPLDHHGAIQLENDDGRPVKRRRIELEAPAMQSLDVLSASSHVEESPVLPARLEDVDMVESEQDHLIHMSTHGEHDMVDGEQDPHERMSTQDEDDMPPKMRKRWIHNKQDILKSAATLEPERAEIQDGIVADDIPGAGCDAPAMNTEPDSLALTADLPFPHASSPVSSPSPMPHLPSEREQPMETVSPATQMANLSLHTPLPIEQVVTMTGLIVQDSMSDALLSSLSSRQVPQDYGTHILAPDVRAAEEHAIDCQRGRSPDSVSQRDLQHSANVADGQDDVNMGVAEDIESGPQALHSENEHSLTAQPVVGELNVDEQQLELGTASDVLDPDLQSSHTVRSNGAIDHLDAPATLPSASPVSGDDASDEAPISTATPSHPPSPLHQAREASPPHVPVQHPFKASEVDGPVDVSSQPMFAPESPALQYPQAQPPPTASKVKLSLKDFAERKKRQREEQLSRPEVVPPESPLDNPSAVAISQIIPAEQPPSVLPDNEACYDSPNEERHTPPLESMPNSNSHKALVEATNKATLESNDSEITAQQLGKRPSPPAMAADAQHVAASSAFTQLDEAYATASHSSHIQADAIEIAAESKPQMASTSLPAKPLYPNGHSRRLPEDGEIALVSTSFPPFMANLPRRPEPLPPSPSSPGYPLVPPTQPRAFANRPSSPRLGARRNVPPAVPSGPRAERSSGPPFPVLRPGSFTSSPSASLSTYVPRGPSADRIGGRGRDRGWGGRGRGFGRGRS